MSSKTTTFGSFETITHKEENELWQEYEHDWPVSSVPRNPAMYEPAPAVRESFRSHFLQKLDTLPGDRENRSRIVRNLIENGTVYPAEEDNRYRLLWTDPQDSEMYSLIVHLRGIAFASESANHYAVTVYRIE
ncbi:hypothetical protein [Halonotius roseus]|uniref:Uncharacterized protein n=1 Tax=Halonotius roseus TaxID=2511997 RepID=A0A544QR06_9EURY|nr:hypothetical protein [Halonotius roseus]TQQ81875.1 hypothetical protein EWF95_02755 [Halonotius roseus]